MKRNIKPFTCGFLAALLLTPGISGYADSLLKQIWVSPNTVSIQVNGKPVIADNFLYEDRTYVQLRNIADLLGIDLAWDLNSRTIHINDNKEPVPVPQEPVVPKPPKEEPAVSGPLPYKLAGTASQTSRLSPAGPGNTVSFTAASYEKVNFDAQITLKELIRGNEAWSRISAADYSNKAPMEEKEYILARLEFHVTKASDFNTQYDLSSSDFTLVSSSGKDYARPNLVIPGATMDSKLYSSASHEGWVAFEVSKEDKDPLMVYGKDGSGKGGVWFKCTPFGTQLNYSLQTPDGIQQFLQTSFSHLTTSMGETEFGFEVHENHVITQPYDYWIKVRFNSQLFNDTNYSSQYTQLQREQTREQLKVYQENVAKMLISLLPNKKLYGGFNNGYDTFPNTTAGQLNTQYFSWTNYDIPSNTVVNKYETTLPSTFRWWPDYDNTFYMP